MDVPVSTNGGSTPRTWTWAVFALILLGATLVACAGRTPAHTARLAEASRKIGEAYMLQGDYTTALRELFKARDLDPENALTHNDLGLCYLAKKHTEKAVFHFEKAVALKPDYSPARNNLGAAYLAADKWDAAIRVFEVVTRDQLYATPHYPLANMGLAYFEKGAYRQALDYFNKALKLQPDFLIALAGKGRTYLAMRQYRPALRYLEKAVDLAPQDPQIRFDLGECYLMLKRWEQARESFSKVIELDNSYSPLAERARKRLSQIQEILN